MLQSLALALSVLRVCLHEFLASTCIVRVLMMPCEHMPYLFIPVRTAAFMWTDLHYQDARSRLGGNSRHIQFSLSLSKQYM